MPTLRDCLGKAGKLISPADAEAMHARSKQYQADGHAVEKAERLSVEHMMSEANAHLDSIYEQVGMKRQAEPVAREPGPRASPPPQKVARNLRPEPPSSETSITPRTPEVAEAPAASAPLTADAVAGMRPDEFVKHYRGKIEAGEEGGLTADAIEAGRAAKTAEQIQQLKEWRNTARDRAGGEIAARNPKASDAGYQAQFFAEAYDTAISQYEASVDASIQRIKDAVSGGPEKPKGEPDAIPTESPSETAVRQTPEAAAPELPRSEGVADVRAERGDVGDARSDGRQDAEKESAGAVQEEVGQPESRPPAQMKRPELRAELSAAGVKEVAGVPLDDANAAQLMNAVGKLRRGQLEDVPKVAAKDAGAEPSVSGKPDIIERLKAKKRYQPGKVYSATEGLYDAAHDAAIDVAILAIRAGRTVADVVRLATQRLKARHPEATAEQISKLESDIQAAITAPPKSIEPSREKSKLPESLKEIGAPVESIEYDVRAQDARKQEAVDIIKREGAERAEGLLVDPSISGDTRVAIGGQLINDRMLSLSEAKPEDVGKITKDIQRITEKLQPQLATEAGQTISMFNALYKDVRVASGIEYVRQATKEKTEKLGGKEVQDATQEAITEIKKADTVADVKKAIEKLKQKYTTKPVRKVLDAFDKKIEDVMELKRIGALTRDDMTEIAAMELGIEGADPKKLKHIAEIADRIKNAKNHAERSRAELEMADMLSIYKGVSPMDIGSSILTANVLSGYTTQGANLQGNVLQGMMQLATLAATNPTRIGPLLRGLVESLPLAATEAGSILRTGRATRDFQDKTGGAGNILSTLDVSRDFPSVPKPIGAVATTGARAIDKIFRFMKAADAVFYYPAREAHARVVTTKLLEGDFKGAELAQKVRETLHITPEAFESARQQAAADGYTGIDLARRTSEIIEERRAQTPAGAAAVKQSEQFAAESTFTQEPVGLAGVFYHGLKYAVEEGRLAGVPVLKPWLMFLKTPTNVFNTITNYTPMGAVRAAMGVRGAAFKNAEHLNFNKDQRNRLYVQSVIGTSLFAGLLYQVLNGDKVDITAKGPDDPSKRRQLMQAGWRPYTFKVGDTRISYKDSPLLLPLAVVGHVADSVRYQKAKSDMLLQDRVVDAMAKSAPVIFDTSMLTGLGDLMDAAHGGDMKRVGRSMGSIPANLVIPYSRLLGQIDQSFDQQSYDTNPLLAGVPFARRTGKPLTDVQGRPQTYNPAARFASKEKNDPVDNVLRDKNIFIPEVGKDVKLGNKVMTDEQRDILRRVSGQRIRIRLEAIAPRLRIMSQEKAQDEVDRISREERERVKPLVRVGAAK